MKKLITLLALLGAPFVLGGCMGSQDLEDAKIYTTVYPISFIAESLYSDHSTINSIYPSGADIESYQLTEKQIDEYAKGDLFIYNGLTEEKQITKDFINENDKLLIIDVSYGLKYTHGIEELWLSPNNFLMLAKNTKENLEEYVDNKYLAEEIEKNYQELEETISIMDADLRSIVTTAEKEKKSTTLVVSSNTLKFLENYGFNIISLEDEENLTENNLNTIKSNFKNSTYTTIFMLDTDKNTDLINSLVEDYKAKTIKIDSMTTLSEENKNNNNNYLTLTQQYIDNIRATLLK